jgi:hypothetical protein
MSKKWFVSRGDNTRGPLTSDEVKQMALTGILHVSDMVRPAESSDWRQAGTITGLFSAELSEARTPPPLPQLNPETSVHPSSPTNSPEVRKLHPSTAKAVETMQTGLADIMSTAKQAKELASAHVRKTQITQFILPKAYLTLGKDVFSSERFQDELSVLFQRITATNDEISKIATTARERPQATDIKGKLQTVAASLLAQGQAAKLGLQRDSQFRALGKKSFELHGTESGTSDVVSPITTALDELQKIDARIAESSSGEKAPLWQRLPVAAFLTLCCFPVGLYLLWHNPRISRRTKLIRGGGFSAVLLFAIIMAQMTAAKAREELAAAHQLWSLGDQQAAISKYRTLVNDSLSIIPESDRSLVLGRVIDFDAESGNTLSVESLLKLAEDKNIVPSVSSEKARSIQETWLADQRRLAQQKAEAERERMVKDTVQQASPDSNSAQPTEAPLRRYDRPAENVYRFTLPKKSQYTDDEFQALNLTGATPKQVLEHFGKPDRVHKKQSYNDAGDFRSSKESWNYYHLVRHSLTEEPLTLLIYFNYADGKVVAHEVL